MSKGSGVIVAKAKSMHGQHLSKEQYAELLHKRSVAEIAGYLKNETSYREVLKDVRENNIHRGQLEDMLRRDIFRKTMKLFRYSDASQRQYYWLHMQQIEIDLILFRIRVLISQGFEDAIADLPIFLKAYLSYDLVKLGNVHSYDELLAVVKNTMYYEVLQDFRVRKGEENSIRYTDIETALQKQYYAHVFETIDKVLKGASKKSVKEMKSIEVELSNITKIYRFKKYFQSREDVIRDSLIPVFHHFTPAKREELLSQQNLKGFLQMLANSRYHLNIEEKDNVFIEYHTEKYLYEAARHNIYYAQDAPTVFNSYLVLQNRELENIINIIEGIRYHVDVADIEQMLIY